MQPNENETIPRPVPRLAKVIAGRPRDERLRPNELRAVLAAMPIEDRRAGLAYALVRSPTREDALRALALLERDDTVVPFLLVALKWGAGPEQLRGVKLVDRWKVTRALPVLLRHVVGRDYVKTRGIYRDAYPARPGATPQVQVGEVAVEGLFAETARVLDVLSGGRIGHAGLPANVTSTWAPLGPPAAPDGWIRNAKPPSGWNSRAARKRWRKWWWQHHAEAFPTVPVEEPTTFASEKEVRAWCKTRRERFGPDLVEGARESITAFVARPDVVGATRGQRDRSQRLDVYVPVSRWPTRTAGWDRSQRLDVYVPATVSGPVHTAVLFERSLDATARAPSREKAREVHRLAMLCLARSRDGHAVTSFIRWWHRHGSVRDPQAELYAVSHMDDPRVVEVIEAIAAESPSENVPVVYGRALARTGRAEAVPPLATLAAGDHPAWYYRFLSREMRNLVEAGGPKVGAAAVRAFKPLLAAERAETVGVALDVMAMAERAGVIREALAAVKRAMDGLAGDERDHAKNVIEALELKLTRRSPSLAR